MFRVSKNYLGQLRKHSLTTIIYTLMLLGIAILMLLLSSPDPEATAATALSPERAGLKFVFIDEDQSELSQLLEEHLNALYTPKDVPTDEENLKEMLFTWEITAAVKVPAGFQEDFASGDQEIFIDFAPNAIDGYTLKAEVNRFMGLAEFFQREKELLGAPQTWQAKDFDRLREALAKRSKTKSVSNPDVSSQQTKQQDPGLYRILGYTLMAALLTLLTNFANDFRNGSIVARLRLGQMSQIKQLTARSIAELLVSLLTLIVMLGGMLITKGIITMDWRSVVEGLGKNILAALCLALFVIALSHLLSKITTVRTVSAAVTVISLGLAFISGAFVPRKLLGSLPITIAKFFPLYYYIDIVEGTYHSPLNYLPQYAIMLLMVLLTFALGFFVDRYKPRENLLSVRAEN